MATIAQIVAQIRTAIFGRDVRENIAQGIEKCYDDVSTGVTIADAAAANANTKAGLANDAATLANTKAGLADSAATAANTAATAAENVNASVSKSGNTVTFSVTNRNGVTSTADLSMEGSIDDTKGLGDTDFVWSADKDVKELLKLDGEKADTDSMYTSRTASGSIVEIEDAVAEAVKQMRIEIAPLQDLHGYDAPWVGGASKNHWDDANAMVASTITRNGSEYIYNGISSGVQILQYYWSIPSDTQNIAISFYAKAETAGAKITVDGQPDGVTGVGTDEGFELTTDYIRYTKVGSFDSTTTGFRFFRTSTTTLATSKIYVKDIQIEYDSNVTDYMPYSNICPISGWTGAKVVDDNKENLIPTGTDANNGYVANKYLKSDNTTSTPVTGYTMYVSEYFPVEPNKNCYFGFVRDNPVAKWTVTGMCFYDKDKNYISGVNLGGHIGVEFVVPSNAVYARSSQLINYNKLCFDYSHTYNITFPSAAGTVYSGTLTVNADGTGTVVVDRAGVIGADVTWGKIANYGSVTRFDYSNNNIKAGSGRKLISSSFETKASIGTNNVECTYIHGSDHNLQLQIQTARLASDDATGLHTWFTNNPTTFVYELATPVTYTITTDQVVHLLNGHNTVWADCGDISFDYYAEKYLTTEQAEKERIHESITTSAPIQTFHDGADNAPMGLKVAVEPVQDLHGYSNPWVGGAGKNKLDTPTTTTGGITFAQDADGYVTASESTDSRSWGYSGSQYKMTLPSGTYKFVWQIKTAATNAGRGFRVYDSSGSILADGYTTTVDTSGSALFTLSESTEIGVFIKECTMVARFMIIASTETTDWSPYQNICPISGHDKAEVTRTGKNLLEKIYAGGINNTTGQDETATNGVCDYIRVKTQTTYALSGSTIGGYTIRYFEYDQYKNFITTNTATAVDGVVNIITGGTTNYIRLKASSSVLVPNGSYQFEEGTVATTYEPYNGKKYTIPFNTTMYGGYLTVGKDGEVEVTVTHAFVDLGDLSWSYKSSPNMFGSQSLSYKAIGGSKVPNAKAEAFKASSINSFLDNSPNGAFAFGSTGSWNGYLCIRNTAYTDATEFKASVTGSHLYYELANPVTVKLNHCTIRSLLGTNNIWADTGDIEEIHWSADVKSYIDNQNADGMIAQTEASMTATKAYAEGELFTVKSKLYKATSAIAIGDALVVGTNCTETTVADECNNNGSAGMIAQTEDSMIATKAYAEGELFAVYSTLYKATSAIAIGDALVIGTNCIETTVANEISAILNSTATGVSF